jgi:peptidoglycan hydrolase CwlO-like protein
MLNVVSLLVLMIVMSFILIYKIEAETQTTEIIDESSKKINDTQLKLTQNIDDYNKVKENISNINEEIKTIKTDINNLSNIIDNTTQKENEIAQGMYELNNNVTDITPPLFYRQSLPKSG